MTKKNKKKKLFSFKKKKKDEINYKKVAIFVLVVASLIAFCYLIKEAQIAKRGSVSEVLSIGNYKVEDAKIKNKVLMSYKAYKKFLKEYNIKGNLTSADFKYHYYIVSLQTYSQDYEKERKKLVEISNSDANGVNLVFNIYNYCDTPAEVEVYAIIVPVKKNSLSSASVIENVYNDLAHNTCEVGE